MNIPVDNPLSHLTEDKVSKLISEYYEGIRVAELIAKYDLDVRPTKLVSFFPDKTLEDKCVYCQANLSQKRLSKTAGKTIDKIEKLPFCSECGHIEYSLAQGPIRFGGPHRCECSNCREKLNEVVHTYIVDFNATLPRPAAPEFLSYQDKIYLAALTNYQAPIDNDIQVGILELLSVSPAHGEYMLSHLLSKGLLRISADCPYSSFIMDGDKIVKMVLSKVHFKLNISCESHKTLSGFSAWCLQSIKTNIDSNELYPLYREWAYTEIFHEYLALGKYYFYHKPNVGKETKKAIGFIVDNFSIGEGFHILDRVIRRAREYGNDPEIGSKRGANSIPQNIFRFGNYLLDNGIETKTVPFNEQVGSNGLRDVMMRLLSFPSSEINQRIDEKTLCCFGKTGDYGNPIKKSVTKQSYSIPPVSTDREARQESFAQSQGVTPDALRESQNAPPLELDHLQEALDDRRWSIEFVSDETGIDVERLFSIVRGQSVASQLESATLIFFFHEN
jgi:hypothetical protein